MSTGLITEVVVTPVAMKDPPLRNVNGIHQPYALRSIVELRTDTGHTGLGETYGDRRTLDALRTVAPRLSGLDPFDLNGLAGRVDEALGVRGAVDAGKPAASVLSTFEVACWDLRGRLLGRPVVDLLGGRVRDAVPYAGYLFFKPAEHAPDPGYPADRFGAAMTAEGVVELARTLVAEYGFGSLKLKGGVLPPHAEIDVVLALRDAFPDSPLRIDPNEAWTVDTSVAVAHRLDGVLEYLEDPTAGIAGMAEVARRVPVPLATNMCVTSFAHLRPAVEQGAVRIVLADHHYWGGLGGSRELAAVCRTFGMEMSMHSNSHLGISLAAMTHFAAASPEVTHACDTHYPYLTEDVVVPGALRFTGGAVPVPDGPGLGVELDRDAMARLAEQYTRCGFDRRDDVTPMLAIDPQWSPGVPRW